MVVLDHAATPLQEPDVGAGLAGVVGVVVVEVGDGALPEHALTLFAISLTLVQSREEHSLALHSPFGEFAGVKLADHLA
jgi:hypothetical protein